MTDCLFETLLPGSGAGRAYYFREPAGVYALKDPSKAEDFFKSLEKLAEKYYVAGFISYELGYALEKCFGKTKPSSFPLALFGVYKKVRTKEVFRPAAGNYRIKNLRLNISKAEYLSSVKKIKRHIRAGDIYQADYTLKYKFSFTGDARVFYEDLKKKQRAPYAAYMKFGEMKILSLSPELFFSKRGRDISVKPMKGTLRRGFDEESDRRQADFLFRDEKNRSENLMITDLMRNDLGRIASPGTVKTEKMFHVEKYDTLFQMTSTVKAKIRRGVDFYGIIRNIFPSGSVTGAPKILSMEILRGLESEKRNVYTGAAGFLAPGGRADFNVPIRTVLIRGAKAEMGVGSGIVYDSKPGEEYAECVLKAEFLKGVYQEFRLIETMLFDGELKNLRAHLSRLRSSAAYFDFSFDERKIRAALARKTRALPAGRWKVRALLAGDGALSVSVRRASEIPEVPKLVFSPKRVDSSDRFLYHKTTRRALFDAELERVRKKGFFDAVFVNEKGFVTEGAVTNIYAEKKGVIYTPPVSCGLMRGTVRSWLLSRGKVKEKNMTPDYLKKADAVYVSNALIGLHRADI
ncbi:MAG: aminodeoxychorismate synthase, component I [Elusimicrobia bacterium CG_4_10_14_3_um_filter_49_12_50_7]|nr:MAG: aminodeoxychorismate synthase, component I [Elusimicrobia bacterium CG_4_10_14_3_um_filter_49_12_50_7]